GVHRRLLFRRPKATRDGNIATSLRNRLEQEVPQQIELIALVAQHRGIAVEAVKPLNHQFTPMFMPISVSVRKSSRTSPPAFAERKYIRSICWSVPMLRY